MRAVLEATRPVRTERDAMEAILAMGLIGSWVEGVAWVVAADGTMRRAFDVLEGRA